MDLSLLEMDVDLKTIFMKISYCKQNVGMNNLESPISHCTSEFLHPSYRYSTSFSIETLRSGALEWEAL